MGTIESTGDPGAAERVAALEEELSDLQIMYDTTLEHSTALETELMLQNERLDALQRNMRRYLSPQLYQALAGGTADMGTTSHRRVCLTVYFSDMVGFSELTDSLEPELLSRLLNAYLTRMAEIALRHGGTIDKFIGDAVMVFFGAPEYTSDLAHARNCMLMALEMRDAIAELSAEWRSSGVERPLRVRAGINTGFCTVGNFGSENRMDYTIIGSQVNLAARLQGIALPDHIYISGATHALVGDLVEAESLGPMTVKGIHTPVEVWDARGLRLSSDRVGEAALASEALLRRNPFDVDPHMLTPAERVELRHALERLIDRL